MKKTYRMEKYLLHNHIYCFILLSYTFEHLSTFLCIGVHFYKPIQILFTLYVSKNILLR